MRKAALIFGFMTAAYVCTYVALSLQGYYRPMRGGIYTQSGLGAMDGSMYWYPRAATPTVLTLFAPLVALDRAFFHVTQAPP